MNESSFIVLWYEMEQEETRMADKRIRMARADGANIIVTACPFCDVIFAQALGEYLGESVAY